MTSDLRITDSYDKMTVDKAATQLSFTCYYGVSSGMLTNKKCQLQQRGTKAKEATSGPTLLTLANGHVAPWNPNIRTLQLYTKFFDSHSKEPLVHTHVLIHPRLLFLCLLS
eukprot:c30392_g1_i1 orf=214-546(+)